MKWHRELQAAAAEVANDHGLDGYRIEHGGKHLKIILGAGNSKRTVTASATPSDLHAIHNVGRDLRRAARALMPPQAPQAVEMAARMPPPPILAPSIVPVHQPDVLYHYSTSGALPWIIEGGELRPMDCKFARPYLWATTSPDGDRCATGFNDEAYRVGAMVRLRFTMPADGFRPWQDVLREDGQYRTIELLERFAREKKQRTDGWYVRRDAVSLDDCIYAHCRGYLSHRWSEFGATDTSEANVFPIIVRDEDSAEEFYAVHFGSKVYLSRQCDDDGPLGWAYSTFAMDATEFLEGMKAL